MKRHTCRCGYRGPLPLIVASLLLCLLLPAWVAGQRFGPERDAWQRPEEVMDALGVGRGDVVADIGSGRGYFSFKLAARVGPTGKVYAVDLQEERLADLRAEAAERALGNIVTVHNEPDDPELPPGCCDVALVVNAYHEFREPDGMLEGIYEALVPGGKLAIIDGKIESGQEREHYYQRHRIPFALVREEAEGRGFLTIGQLPGFTRTEDGREFWFALFLKPPAAAR